MVEISCKSISFLQHHFCSAHFPFERPLMPAQRGSNRKVATSGKILCSTFLDASPIQLVFILSATLWKLTMVQHMLARNQRQWMFATVQPKAGTWQQAENIRPVVKEISREFSCDTPEQATKSPLCQRHFMPALTPQYTTHQSPAPNIRGLYLFIAPCQHPNKGSRVPYLLHANALVHSWGAHTPGPNRDGH